MVFTNTYIIFGPLIIKHLKAMEKIKDFFNKVKEAFILLFKELIQHWLWAVTYFVLIMVATTSDIDATWRTALAGVWLIVLIFFHLRETFENK